MTRFVLVHGGLWEDMDAKRFWRDTGVVDGLGQLGHEVIAPDRLPRATGWDADANCVAEALDGTPSILVAGSNGCAIGALLAIQVPELVRGLVLGWPATAGDPVVDARYRRTLRARGATCQTIDALLKGGTLRGVLGLDRIRQSVGVVPSVPENSFHQRRTVDALLREISGAEELPGCPEPPHPDFPIHLSRLLRALHHFAAAIDL